MLLPLKTLDGGDVWVWNRVAWLIAFIVAVMLYSIVLVPPPGSWQAVAGPVIAWFIVFGIYAMLVVALWAVLPLTARRKMGETAGSVQVD